VAQELQVRKVQQVPKEVGQVLQALLVKEVAQGPQDPKAQQVPKEVGQVLQVLLVM